MEPVALSAVMILPALILQKPFRTSKSKDHVMCIEKLWHEGQFLSLLEEGSSIQHRLFHSKKTKDDSQIAKKFADLMMNGKVKAAARLVSEERNIGVIPLDRLVEENVTVRDIIHDKHPTGQPIHPSTLISPSQTNDPVHPIIFEEIDGLSILKSALQTTGGAGPSGMDASAWRRMCASFQKASTDLCEALART